MFQAEFFQAPYFGAFFFGQAESDDGDHAVYGATVEVLTMPPSVGARWELCDRGRALIPSGNAVQLSVAWLELDDDAATPTAVQWQVFEARTGASVSSKVILTDLDSTMAIVIPGSALPASTLKQRPLEIQVRGTFANGQHTIVQPIYVQKLHAYT